MPFHGLARPSFLALHGSDTTSEPSLGISVTNKNSSSGSICYASVLRNGKSHRMKLTAPSQDS